MTAGWTVVVPVKDTRRGKSRLDLPVEHRGAFVRALALDTLAAIVSARAVGQVLVVVETADDSRSLSEIPGVLVHLTAARDLNAALTDGLAQVRDGPVATLPADLPGLLPADLDLALQLAADHEVAVVADRDGTGTTLLAAARPDRLHPRYGPDSYRRHLAGGAVGLPIPAHSTLRHDVDLAADSDALGPRSGPAWLRMRRQPGCA